MGELKVLGSRWRWVADLGAVGVLAPTVHAGVGIATSWWVPGVVGTTLWFAAPVVLVSGAVGAVLGWVAPPFLEWVRGRVPLWLLTVLASLIGATWATVVFWVLGIHDPWFAAVSMLFGGLLGAITFLPYTMAATLRMPRWPVLVGVVLAAVVAGLF